ARGTHRAAAADPAGADFRVRARKPAQSVHARSADAARQQSECRSGPGSEPAARVSRALLARHAAHGRNARAGRHTVRLGAGQRRVDPPRSGGQPHGSELWADPVDHREPDRPSRNHSRRARGISGASGGHLAQRLTRRNGFVGVNLMCMPAGVRQGWVFGAVRRGIARLAWAAAALMVAGTAAAQGEGRSLRAIDVQPLTGQRLELRLQTDGPAPQPTSFTIDDPARIAIDLPDTTLGTSRRQDVNLGPLRNIQTAESNGRTRVVLNLNAMVPYDTRVDGNTVYVVLGQSASVTQAATFAGQPASTAMGVLPRSAAASGPRSIDNIDFRRGPDGAGQVVVQLTDPRTTVDVREEGGRIVVEFRDTALPADLMRRLDVTDFATPVAMIDAVRNDRHARLVVSASSPYEQIAYQSDNVFTLELKPPVEEESPPGVFDANKEYVGERLTLNFQDIETRAVLQLLAETSGINIVVSDTVQGNVTLRLQNVPWDQALDILMTTKGLDMRRNGNVMIVAPAQEIAAREQAALQARRAIQELEPLRSELIQVNYAKASELANLIRGGGGTNALISQRGSVAVDERTNTLLVQDTPDRLGDIRRLVATLDIPVRQVLIESRIVIVNDDYRRNLGVRFGTTVVGDRGNDGLVSLTG